MATKAEHELTERCIQSHLNMIKHHRKAILDLKRKMMAELQIETQPLAIEIKK
jgi:hypothetical protein